MTTTINDITDLIRILEQQPQWANALRSILLSPELLELPEKFAEFVVATNDNFRTVNRRLESLETGQAELRADVAELKEGQQRLENRVNQMAGDVANLKGTDYEGYASRMARRLARRHFNLSKGRIVSNRSNFAEASEMASAGVRRGLITDEESEELELTDIIVTGQDEDDQPVYVAMEVSITIQDHDVERAEMRAEVLSRATGVKAMPAAIGRVVAADLSPTQIAVILLPEQEVVTEYWDPRTR